MLPKWKRCRDAANGQDAIHEAGAEYLPKLKDQADADYNAYVLRAGFFNATWRTISGLVGMVLRTLPVVSVPASVEPLLKDITLSGVPLNAFAQTIIEEALEKGRVGILVDCPAVQSNGNATLADAIAQNIRPTMQMYEAESIINWKTETINNAVVLSLVVLVESENIYTDEWTAKAEPRWRELALVNGKYRQRLFKKDATGAAFTQISDDIFPVMNNRPMDFIPFLFIGTDDLTPDIDEPPLIDLVNVNLAHYRVTADYEHGCHFTGLPTAVVSGYVKNDPNEKLYIGSANAWVFPDPAAKATYLEFTGGGLSALVDNLKAKEQHMAVLGARMLEPQVRGVQAPEAMSIHRKGEESMLAATAQTVSMGIEIALNWLSAWAGSPDEQSEFDFNRDFYPAAMSAQELTALLSAWQMGAPGFSDQELFAKLKRGDMIVTDTTVEEELARIANRQIELANQQAAFNAPPADAAPPTAPPAQNITINLPKGSGTRTVTGPEGKTYTIKEAA